MPLARWGSSFGARADLEANPSGEGFELLGLVLEAFDQLLKASPRFENSMTFTYKLLGMLFHSPTRYARSPSGHLLAIYVTVLTEHSMFGVKCSRAGCL